MSIIPRKLLHRVQNAYAWRATVDTIGTLLKLLIVEPTAFNLNFLLGN
jgi:hypothetical protein